MNFSYYIAKRYLISKSKNNAINIITMIAAIGVFAGAFALFVVLSGFAGLKQFSLNFTNEFDPDLKVIPAQGKTFDFTSVELKKLQSIPEIKAFSTIVEERVLLEYNDKYMPITLKGVDENYLKVNSADSSLVSGLWFHPEENQTVIGYGVSRKLSLGVAGYGDVLKVMVPKPGKGQITDVNNAFNSQNALVTGIFSVNEEINEKYIFTPKAFARSLLNYKENQISGIEIRTQPDTDEAVVKEKLQAIFGTKIDLKNRIELNDALYKMLNTENLVVYLIFTLVLIIALFNVGGAIVMAILDKQHNIKTMHHLGATPREIKHVFLLQGGLLTFVGGVLGLLIGVIIVYLQLHFSWVMITPTLPYPVKVTAGNIILVFTTIMILGFTASYIGATRVQKVLA
ncbi:ABC transporter permease [Mesonia sp. K7]|uniref:ABC transporter permease n=1 Tax=Mesonia sp. K7 TaxID=2218606 RepID=UPI000DA7B854|nr:ABC transporter permease [Mesonia sp. K7]PZD79157.1 ABC transporter permease [Mesonia sp. K7]